MQGWTGINPGCSKMKHLVRRNRVTRKDRIREQNHREKKTLQEEKGPHLDSQSIMVSGREPFQDLNKKRVGKLA